MTVITVFHHASYVSHRMNLAWTEGCAPFDCRASGSWFDAVVTAWRWTSVHQRPIQGTEILDSAYHLLRLSPTLAYGTVNSSRRPGGRKGAAHLSSRTVILRETFITGRTFLRPPLQDVALSISDANLISEMSMRRSLVLSLWHLDRTSRDGLHSSGGGPGHEGCL